MAGRGLSPRLLEPFNYFEPFPFGKQLPHGQVQLSKWRLDNFFPHQHVHRLPPKLPRKVPRLLDGGGGVDPELAGGDFGQGDAQRVLAAELRLAEDPKHFAFFLLLNFYHADLAV